MNRMRRWAYLIFVLLLPLTGLGFSVHLSFISRFVGHEEITRQAIKLTEIIAKKNPNIGVTNELLTEMTRIDKLPGGLEAVSIDFVEKYGYVENDNPIVFGNYAADKPTVPDWITKYDTNIFTRNLFPADKDMLKWGGARAFHFTLNEYLSDNKLNPATATPTYVGVTPRTDVFYQSGAQACYEAKAFISNYSQWGMDALAQRAKIVAHEDRKKLLRTALFRFGVATHIIQDSFSPSHTFRSPRGQVTGTAVAPEFKNFDVIDVCYYDQVVAHASTTGKEWGHNILWQDSLDDGLDEANQVVMTPARRLQDSRAQTAPCAHGKFDKNDNIWLSTRVQADILAGQNWSKWEEEIWSNEEFQKDDDSDRKDAAEDLQSFCNHQRFKSSEFSAFKCLKHEARLARSATMKYFLVLLGHVQKQKLAGREQQLDLGEVQDELLRALETQFFEGSNQNIKDFGLNEIMPLGTIRCEQIKTPAYRNTDGKFSIIK